MDDELMEIFNFSSPGSDSPEDVSLSSNVSNQSLDLSTTHQAQKDWGPCSYSLPPGSVRTVDGLEKGFFSENASGMVLDFGRTPDLTSNIFNRVQMLLQAGQAMRPAPNCSNTGFQQPIPKSGLLELTEEESRLLVREGYQLPWTLPLSKDKEAALKRARRRIKNKISAQDSRRKRKAYVDSLESSLKDLLDLTNSLQAQLHQAEASNMLLQHQLISKPPCASCEAPSGLRAAGTTFFMAILCFAVAWSGGHPPAASFAPVPASSSPRPALPWIAATCEVSDWRWSPERHFRPHPGRSDFAENGVLPAVTGPEPQSIGDGRSRWLSAPEDIDFADIGPQPQWRLVTTPNASFTEVGPAPLARSMQCPRLPLKPILTWHLRTCVLAK